MAKPIKTLEDLHVYCSRRGRENIGRANRASLPTDERWHAGKGDTYFRIANKIEEMLRTKDPAQKSHLTGR